MEKTLNLLVVEDDPRECQEIVGYVDELDDVKIVAVTNTADKAIEYVQDYLPHAIILDLELHQGGGNGIQFLQRLWDINPRPYPYILVTTNNTSAITHASTRSLGADFVMVKSQIGYSAENTIEFLRALKNTIFRAFDKQGVGDTDDDAPEKLRQRIYARVATEMDRIGISPKAVGRKYLIDGIVMLYDGTPHSICAAVAQKYSKSDASVERAMQNAISKAWRTTNIDDLQTYYTARISSAKAVPTITEFLHYYADRLKTKY